jgi:hypothetical protein
MEIYNYFRPVPASSTLHSFDAMKFMKRMKAKEKIGWWRRFLESVEEKRNEIQYDLQLYKSAKQN